MYWIRDLRGDADCKQTTLARYLGVTQSTYSAYESGAINIPADARIRIADLCRVSLDYLTGRTEQKEKR